MACTVGSEKCILAHIHVCVEKKKKDGSGTYTTWQRTPRPCAKKKEKKD